MHSPMSCISKHANGTANTPEAREWREIALLAEKIKELLAYHQAVLKDAGIRKEVRQLEGWLEAECNGPAPATIISRSGMDWLKGLRDKLKLSAEEAQRMESEGGAPRSKEQLERTEELLKTVRRIDKIIDESTISTSHDIKEAI